MQTSLGCIAFTAKYRRLGFETCLHANPSTSNHYQSIGSVKHQRCNAVLSKYIMSQYRISCYIKQTIWCSVLTLSNQHYWFLLFIFLYSYHKLQSRSLAFYIAIVIGKSLSKRVYTPPPNRRAPLVGLIHAENLRNERSLCNAPAKEAARSKGAT